MPRLWPSTRLGLAAAVVPLCLCACSKVEEPNPGLGAKPPGHVGMDDPRSRGSFDEIPNGKGGLIKRWSKAPAR